MQNTSLKRKRGIGLWDKCFDIYSSNKYPKIKFRIFSEILVHYFLCIYDGLQHQIQ